MQLAISADVLVPLGAGAVTLLIALFVVLTRGRRKRSGDPVEEPPAAAQPTTVAEAVAVRQADAASSVQWEQLQRPPAADTPAGPGPHPSAAARTPAPDDDTAAVPAPRVTGDAQPAESPARPAPADPVGGQAPAFARPQTAGASRTVADAVTQALAARAAAGRRACPIADDTPGAQDPAVTRYARQAPEGAPAARDSAAAGVDPGHVPSGGGTTPAQDRSTEDTTPVQDPSATAVRPAQGPASGDSAHTGDTPHTATGDTISAPKADGYAALAADIAAYAPPAPDTAGYAPARSSGPAPGIGSHRPSPPGGTTARRGDARDRLLAVLLDDPVRAVGATVELERCREQLDRLTDAVHHERRVLAAVLHRLSAAGLEFGQIVRLAGMPADEVRALLERSDTRPS
ncbi:hypothetical protein [Pseudonocardia sp. H11422]|uniref:hypothetical protein n=1 Tax=Pseudonocardia sp. H11422 TaxID=2835866 RepID=UPI001BDC6895|nr:hypothetical protein [Pseudonocardia sp. H11422]